MAPRARTHLNSFTLVEVVVTITVLGVMGALGAGIVAEGGRALARARDTTDGLSECAYALERIEIDLSGLADRSQVTAMGAHSMTLSISGSPVTYALSGTDLLRGSKALAKNVTAFNLTYYKADGTLAAAAADLNRIGIEVAVTCNGDTTALRTEVFPRTFRNSYTPPGADGTDSGVNGRGGRRWWWHSRLWRWTRHRFW